MKFWKDTIDSIKVADQKGRILLGSRYAGKRFALQEEPDGSALLTPVLILPESEQPITSRRLAESFAGLERLRDNWDGYGSLAPSQAILTYAREVLAMLHAASMARSLPWIEPHLSANERGQVTMEWWHGERTLTLFVRSEEQVDYLKAWGSHIESDMEDGEVGRLAEFVALSRWLYWDENQKEKRA